MDRCRTDGAVAILTRGPRVRANPQILESESQDEFIISMGVEMYRRMRQRREKEQVMGKLEKDCTSHGWEQWYRFGDGKALCCRKGRRQESLDAAVKEIGSNVTAVQGDVSKLDDLDRLFAQIKQEKGKLDVLFANAGGGEFVPLGSYTEEHFDETFNINVKGLVFTVQKALPLLPDGATIVLNGSIVSVKGFENFGVYNATKAAVRSFARTWTTELKARKIRVNVVSPGPIDTPAIAGLVGNDNEQEKKLKANLAAGVPLGRMGRPDELAKTVVFCIRRQQLRRGRGAVCRWRARSSLKVMPAAVSVALPQTFDSRVQMAFTFRMNRGLLSIDDSPNHVSSHQ
jgi:NAD(P)-dependent dehydrogenase (short-subunit alcohol dehydrogenase family)